MGTPSTDSEQEGRIRRKTVNMEGFSIPTASVHEEWMDLADIVNNDLENDLEKKKLSDFSGFDVVGLFNNNNNVDAKVVAAREGRTSSLTGYSHYSPASPSDSWISTEDFPEELDELQP